MGIKLLIKRIVNRLTPKKAGYIYAVPHENGTKDGYWLGNYGSDNLLTFLAYLRRVYSGSRLTVFCETRFDPAYEQKRIDRIWTNSNITIRAISSAWDTDGCFSMKRYIRSLKYRYSSSHIWTDTPSSHCEDCISSQTVFCFNYYTPFKNDFSPTNCRLFDSYDLILTTGLLPAQISVASIGGRLDRYLTLGFPRNDLIASGIRSEKAAHWLDEHSPEGTDRIIVYAPTYSEYAVNDPEMLFGYDDGGELNSWLADHRAILVYRPHPLEKYEFSGENNRILCFPYSEEFGFYDILSCADVLVSNYSSVANDFLLTGRPVVYNMTDLDTYNAARGLSFEPVSNICAGRIVSDWNGMASALEEALENGVPAELREKYSLCKSWLHAHTDGNSCERILSFMKKSGILP